MGIRLGSSSRRCAGAFARRPSAYPRRGHEAPRQLLQPGLRRGPQREFSHHRRRRAGACVRRLFGCLRRGRQEPQRGLRREPSKHLSVGLLTGASLSAHFLLIRGFVSLDDSLEPSCRDHRIPHRVGWMRISLGFRSRRCAGAFARRPFAYPRQGREEPQLGLHCGLQLGLRRGLSSRSWICFCQ